MEKKPKKHSFCCWKWSNIVSDNSTAFISNQKWEKEICNQKSLHKQPLLLCPFSVPVSDSTVGVFRSSGDVQKPAEFHGRCAHSQGCTTASSGALPPAGWRLPPDARTSWSVLGPYRGQIVLSQFARQTMWSERTQAQTNREKGGPKTSLYFGQGNTTQSKGNQEKPTTGNVERITADEIHWHRTLTFKVKQEAQQFTKTQTRPGDTAARGKIGDARQETIQGA